MYRISANHHNKVPEAVEACRELLHSYSKCINDMLKRQREPSVFLELLTGKYVFILFISKFTVRYLSVQVLVLGQDLCGHDNTIFLRLLCYFMFN